MRPTRPQTIPQKRPRKTSPVERIGGLLLNAGAVRSIVEAFLLYVVLELLIFAGGRLEQSGAASTQILTLGPLCAIFCALRLRLLDGERRSIFPRELAKGSIFAVLIGATSIAVVTADRVLAEGQLYPLLTPEQLFIFSPLVFGWNLGAFGFFRGLTYLWPRWTRLRRSRLRWEMTHTTLLAVAGVSSALILAFMVLLAGAPVFSNGIFSLPGQFATLLPVFGVLVFLAVVAIGVVLPLAALVSYFTARRTARRLEALAHGTSGLREGDFDIRVDVDGDDEVSELQRDFNAMAGELGGAMRDLRSERDNVERLLNTQRELVASVSHELRTPVATMRGYLESALCETPGLRAPEGLREDLEIVQRETVRLQRLIDDLFVLSRAESGRLSLQTSPTDVPALLSRCAEAVSDQAWKNGKVEVILDAGTDLSPVLADEGRLEQAVRNLLSNAVRHTPPGGLVALGASIEPGAVIIEVKDTGEGIPSEDRERIFERFYRSDNARDGSGAGLGLALVKELTEAMGGEVGFESEPGTGSRFTLRLPVA